MTVASGAELEFASTAVTQLTVSGSLSFASGSLITVDSISPAPAVGSSFNLIVVTGTGSLNDLGVVVTVPNGYSESLTTGKNGNLRITRLS
jgi:hypothetical protein